MKTMTEFGKRMSFTKNLLMILEGKLHSNKEDDLKPLIDLAARNKVLLQFLRALNIEGS